MRNLSYFVPGDRAIDGYTGEAWIVVKHGHDGVSVIRSEATGQERAMNTHNNPRYLTAAEAEGRSE